MGLRRLKTRGFPATDQVLLRSMLGLLPGHTTDEWTFGSADEPADLVIVHDEADMPPAWRSGNGSAGLLVAGRRADADLVFPFPLRPRNLAEFLDEASRRLDGGQPPSSSTRQAPTLAELLFRHQASPPASGALVFLAADDDELFTLCRSGLHVRDPDRVVALAERCDIAVRPRDDCHGAVHGEAVPGDLLRWKVGLASTHRLVIGPGPRSRLRLLQWPDFGQLPHRSDHVRMTAHLARQPLAPTELADRTGCPTADAIGLANALLMQGCVQVTVDSAPASAPDSTRPVPARPPGLLTRIRARLGL